MTCTAWKVSKYGVISGPYFPVLGLNTEIYEVNLRIQSEYWKIRTWNNSLFGYSSRSDGKYSPHNDEKYKYFYYIWISTEKRRKKSTNNLPKEN